jgi:GNAT superfamily N-acetyltransferase
MEGEGEAVTLRDGTVAVVRPIRPDDAPRLQGLFSRLSPESIWLRFLSHAQELSDEEAERLANVDYDRRMALVATVDRGGQEEVIAEARYAQIPAAEPGLAEAAIVVEDRYQGLGLGSLLLHQLADYARGRGFSAFLATLRQDNYRILRFIQHSGLPTESHLDSGVWEIKVGLSAEPDA